MKFNQPKAAFSGVAQVKRGGRANLNQQHHTVTATAIVKKKERNNGSDN